MILFDRFLHLGFPELYLSSANVYLFDFLSNIGLDNINCVNFRLQMQRDVGDFMEHLQEGFLQDTTIQLGRKRVRIPQIIIIFKFLS